MVSASMANILKLQRASEILDANCFVILSDCLVQTVHCVSRYIFLKSIERNMTFLVGLTFLNFLPTVVSVSLSVD